MLEQTIHQPSAPSRREPAVVVRNLEDARDRDLVLRVGRGDEEAFRALFRRHGPLAKALALRIVRQPFMAEEIVQEAFLALWRNPGSFRPDRGTFLGWLVSTVHHRAVDLIRREESQRRRAEESRTDTDTEPDLAEAVVEGADLAERRNRVRAALDGIPSEQREILELMYFERKTQSMIAQELELPLGTVKSRTLLGMRRLRTILAEPSR